jgi:hypothetical protein
LSFLFGSSTKHCDLEGPAGITLIQRLLFGSGGEHCDLELAEEKETEEAGQPT